MHSNWLWGCEHNRRPSTSTFLDCYMVYTKRKHGYKQTYTHTAILWDHKYSFPKIDQLRTIELLGQVRNSTSAKGTNILPEVVKFLGMFVFLENRKYTERSECLYAFFFFSLSLFPLVVTSLMHPMDFIYMIKLNGTC